MVSNRLGPAKSSKASASSSARKAKSHTSEEDGQVEKKISGSASRTPY